MTIEKLTKQTESLERTISPLDDDKEQKNMLDESIKDQFDKIQLKL